MKYQKDVSKRPGERYKIGNKKGLIKPMNIDAIFHLYANIHVPDDLEEDIDYKYETKTEAFEVKGCRLYCTRSLSKRLIAYKSLKNNILFVDKNFTSSIKFTGNYSSYNITRAFSNANVVEVDRNNIIFDYDTLEVRNYKFKHIIREETEKVLGRIFYLRNDVINGQCKPESYFKNNFTSLRAYKELISNIVQVLKIPKYILNAKFYYKQINYVKYYNSWNSNDINEASEKEISIKPFELLNKPIFNLVELRKLYKKVWRYNYLKSEYFPYLTTSERNRIMKGNDWTERKKLEQEVKEKISRKRELQRQKQEKEEKEHIEKLSKNIEEWKSNEITNFPYYHALPYDIFRFKRNSDRIESARGITVSLLSLLKVTRLFKHFIDKNEPAMYIKQNIAGFIADSIVKTTIIGKETILLKVGCHNIVKFELDDFINKYYEDKKLYELSSVKNYKKNYLGK